MAYTQNTYENVLLLSVQYIAAGHISRQLIYKE